MEKEEYEFTEEEFNDFLFNLIVNPKKAVEILSAKEDNLSIKQFKMNDVIESLSKQTGWKDIKLINILKTIYKVDPMCVKRLLIKQIAIEMDKKYNGYIINSKELYIIDSLNVKACLIHKKSEEEHYDRRLTELALFRTKEDADMAYNIMSDFIKEFIDE